MTNPELEPVQFTADDLTNEPIVIDNLDDWRWRAQQSLRDNGFNYPTFNQNREFRSQVSYFFDRWANKIPNFYLHTDKIDEIKSSENIQDRFIPIFYLIDEDTIELTHSFQDNLEKNGLVIHKPINLVSKLGKIAIFRSGYNSYPVNKVNKFSNLPDSIKRSFTTDIENGPILPALTHLIVAIQRKEPPFTDLNTPKENRQKVNLRPITNNIGSVVSFASLIDSYDTQQDDSSNTNSIAVKRYLDNLRRLPISDIVGEMDKIRGISTILEDLITVDSNNQPIFFE